MQNIARRPAGIASGEPVITLENCRHTLVTGCAAEPGTPVFLGLRGARTADITFGGNFLQHAAKPLLPAPEVSPIAVTLP